MGHVFAIPNDYTFRFHALRTLRQGSPNKWNGVVDAVDPGGSGDPYALLNAEEAAALRETTLGGFPLPGWYGHATMGGSAFFLVAQYPSILDPTYADEFWTVPGYYGADSSPGRRRSGTTGSRTPPPSSRPRRRSLRSTTTHSVRPTTRTCSRSTSRGPARTITLDSLPPESEGTLTGEAAVEFPDPDNPGQTIRVVIGTVDRNTNTVGFAGGMPPHRVNMIDIGDDVVIDNGEFLALQTVSPPHGSVRSPCIRRPSGRHRPLRLGSVQEAQRHPEVPAASPAVRRVRPGTTTPRVRSPRATSTAPRR